MSPRVAATRLATGWRVWADLKARARIAARLDRLSLGNFGDCKALREGVCCVLLLCGGDKRRQSSDIRRAIEYLKDFKERTRSK